MTTAEKRPSSPVPGHLATTRLAGHNAQGQPVMAITCECFWTHMTAFTRKGTAIRYLDARYADHLPKGS